VDIVRGGSWTLWAGMSFTFHGQCGPAPLIRWGMVEEDLKAADICENLLVNTLSMRIYYTGFR